MRVVPLLAASAAVLSPIPAQAAIWTIAIQAHVTGTSFVTGRNPDNSPFSATYNDDYAYYDTLDVDSFTGSTTISPPGSTAGNCGNLPGAHPGQLSGYRNCTFSGTLSLVGGQFVGTGLTIFAAGVGCNFSCGVETHLSAPTFQVTFLSSAGGPPPLPEPSTWLMMILGFGLTGYAMRKRQVRVTDLTKSRTMPLEPLKPM